MKKDEIEFTDLEITCCKNSLCHTIPPQPPGVHMQILHIPTNTVVEGTGHSMFKLRARLIDDLNDKLKED